MTRFLRRLLRVWRDAYRAERAARSRERGQCHARFTHADGWTSRCIRPHRHQGQHKFPSDLPSMSEQPAIVLVYDSDGTYLGSMPEETWRELRFAYPVFMGESTQ